MTTSPAATAPSRVERYDYEPRRNGTVNLFVVIDAHQPWRSVTVTRRRTAQALAQCDGDAAAHRPGPGAV